MSGFLYYRSCLWALHVLTYAWNEVTSFVCPRDLFISLGALPTLVRHLLNGRSRSKISFFFFFFWNGVKRGYNVKWAVSFISTSFAAFAFEKEQTMIQAK